MIHSLETAHVEKPELDEFLELVYSQFCHDFRDYARASLCRRIVTGARALGCVSVSELSSRLRREPEAFPKVLSYLTIQVSELFRDPEYFLAFRTQIVPLLAAYPTIKLWVAGCATGEEAYSFAIVLKEAGLLKRSLIYATDIHPESLAKAEQGVRRCEVVPDASARHRASGAICSLSEHYTAAYGSVRFERELRERIVFAEHSLTTDSVFSEVDVVSCRNVLIYFDKPARERALGLFVDALSPGGFLGLGAKESVRFSAAAASFEDFSEQERWYRRR
jgi:chemotaxis protein methyltransferase CheR